MNDLEDHKIRKTSKQNQDLIEMARDAMDEKISLKIDRKVLATWTDDNIDGMVKDRDDWAKKLEIVTRDYDELVYPEKKASGGWKNASNFKVPLMRWMIKQMRARIYAALFGDGFGFVTKGTEVNDENIANEVDSMMRFAVRNYCNEGKGLGAVLDDWIHDTCRVGWGVSMLRWKRRYAKMALTNEELERHNSTQEIEDTLEDNIQIVKVQDCPEVITIDHHRILFPAEMEDSQDLDEPPLVCVLLWMTDAQIRNEVAAGRWSKKDAEKILKMGKKRSTNKGVSSHYDSAKELQEKTIGVRYVNKFTCAKNEYPVWLCFARVDADFDDIEEDLVYYYSPEAKVIPNITMLDRYSIKMRRPLFKIDFDRIPRNAYAQGMAHLLYNQQKQATSMHRQRMDFGLIASMPFFFYKPYGALKKDKIPLEPGKGIPLSNPTTDVYFPRMNTNVFFTRQDESMVVNYAEKTVGLPAITTGQSINPVGASATATGFAGLLNQIGFDFDLMLKNYKAGYSRLLQEMQALMSVKMPDGIKYRVLGEGFYEALDENGVPMQRETSRKILYGNWDYIILANDKALNSEVDKQNAITNMNMMLNPLFLQSGIVSQRNLYFMAKNFLMKNRESNIDSFITKPDFAPVSLTVANEISVILQGDMPTVTLNDDHKGKIESLNMYFSSDSYKQMVVEGIADARSFDVYQKVVKLHEQYLSSITAQANPSNVSGLQVGTTLGARIAGAVDQQTGIAQSEQDLSQGGGEPDLTRINPSGDLQ